MCCNRRDVFKHGRDKVAKDKRLSMLAWKYGLEDCRAFLTRRPPFELHMLGKMSPRSAALAFVPRYNMQH